LFAARCAPKSHTGLQLHPIYWFRTHRTEGEFRRHRYWDRPLRIELSIRGVHALAVSSSDQTTNDRRPWPSHQNHNLEERGGNADARKTR
jgi:hypothetical protein